MRSIFNLFVSVRIFPKLLLTFLLIVGPIYYIGLLINRQGEEHIRTEISSSMLSRVNLYTEILDKDFDKTIRLMQEFINDDDLLNLSTTWEFMTDVERTEATIDVKQRLFMLSQASTFITSAFAMIPSMDRTITSDASTIDDFDFVQFDALWKLKNIYESPLLNWNERLFISLPYPDPGRTIKPFFIIGIEVSRKELASALGKFTNEGGGAVLSGRRIPWTVAGTLGKGNEQMFLNYIESSNDSSNSEEHNILIDGTPYILAQQESERLDLTLSMFVPASEIDKPLIVFKKWLFVLSTISFALVLAFSYSIYRMIHRPLKELIHAFRRLEQGNFNISLKYSLKDEFGYLYDQFNVTVRQLNILVHEVYEQQYRAQHSELRHLQSQINPHFLYNTYFLLYRMALRKDFDNIVPLTKHLGEYFQYITRDGMEEVAFVLEAKHTMTYMEIQAIRFEDRIHSVFQDIPKEVEQILVPRLLLQPIIENAYKHALEQKESNACLIVKTEIKDQVMQVTVEDNGGQLTPTMIEELELRLQQTGKGEPSETTGLINVHRRLRIKYGEGGGIKLELGNHEGLRVLIQIPLKEDMG